MTYEQKFLSLTLNPKFKKSIHLLKAKWSLDQKKFRTVLHVPRDWLFTLRQMKIMLGKKVKKKSAISWHAHRKVGESLVGIKFNDFERFVSDLEKLVSEFNLPHRCSYMLYDFLKGSGVEGKYPYEYPKVELQIKYDPKREIGEILLFLDPDARRKDVYAIWHEVAEWQRYLHKGDKKTQSVKKLDLINTILKSDYTGKRDKIELREKILGTEHYGLVGKEFHEAGKKAKRIEHTYLGRYKKKLKPHTS